MIVRLFILGCLAIAAARNAVRAQLPDGPGKDVTAKLCGNCHGTDILKGRRYDRAAWTETVLKMIGQGAQASEEEFNTVLEYLVKNLGPQASTPINVNKAAAGELEAALGLTQKEAAAIVKYRTGKGAFRSVEDLRKVRALDYTKIEAKKDRLAF